MAHNKRLVIILASQEVDAAEWAKIEDDLSRLSIDTILRSDESGLPVVTGNVSSDVDMPVLLETLNGMSAIRNAEEDSWSFNQ